MAKELAKSYKPSEFEDKIYDFWLEGNYFHAEADPDKKPYTIVMPPPNITGQLHIGHALEAHVGLQRAVAARHRPRLHRDGSENR